MNWNCSVWRKFRTWMRSISGITSTKPFPIRWFDLWNMLQRRGLGFSISPKSTIANTTTSSQRSTPFLLSLLHLMAIYAAMTISQFRSTANMLYSSWTVRKPEIWGQNVRRWCLTNSPKQSKEEQHRGLRRQQTTTAAMDDDSGKP
jgi:hypothetical protein